MRRDAWENSGLQSFLSCTLSLGCSGTLKRGLQQAAQLFRKALEKANLLRDANNQQRSLYSLRHTYATRLIMRGVALPVIAAQLGHADSQMVERHYGHLAPSFIADTIRAAFGTMSLVEPDNVTTIASRA